MMERVFAGDDSEEVVGLARELLPASMTAAATIAALTGEQPETQAQQVIEIACRMSRDLAKTYLDEAAIHRSARPDVPPYGCRRSLHEQANLPQPDRNESGLRTGLPEN